MPDRPVALTVAGSDSGGGAGVQADLKTFEARGAFGTSAVTSVTAQHTRGVEAVADLASETVAAQIDAVVGDFDVRAAKTGMVSTAAIAATVADRLADAEFPVVVDPVMVAQSGDRLLREDAVSVLRDDLLPRATLVTPNVPEAELLAGIDVDGPDAMVEAAERIRELGPDAVLVTGGHLGGTTDEVVDVLVGAGTETFRKPRHDTPHTHGSGCTLSAAVAAELAAGASLPAAVARAETFVDRAIRFGLDQGGGASPVHHLAELRHRAAVADTAEAVRGAVRAFERADVSRLVPEVGMNVAAAPPYAVDPAEIVAVDGRLSSTRGGVRAAGDVRPGASSHVARFLLGVREVDPEVGAVCNVRLDDATEAAARDRWDVVAVDRADEPDDASGTMDWVAAAAMADRDAAPDAVFDRGAVGKEPMLRVLAPSVASLEEKVLELDRAV